MTERPVGEVAAASVLEAEPEAVWAWVTTPEGITAELMPLMRTTVPDGLSPLDLDSIELGKPIGRSWVLLFGFLPIDCDEIKLVELSPPRCFVERGRLLSQRYWRHERTIEPLEDGGCVLTDRVAWRPRLPVPPGTLARGSGRSSGTATGDCAITSEDDRPRRPRTRLQPWRWPRPSSASSNRSPTTGRTWSST